MRRFLPLYPLLLGLAVVTKSLAWDLCRLTGRVPIRNSVMVQDIQSTTWNIPFHSQLLTEHRKNGGNMVLSARSSSTPPRSENSKNQPSQERPTPAMPSRLFQDLAQSQLELLAGALTTVKKYQEFPSLSSSSSSSSLTSKVKSMALYLPQENMATGQLEFIPAVLYPPPSRDRVFIASEADSGVAPTIPRTLTTLPGFSQARALLPGYPMVQSGDEPGIGAVEEVFCAVDGTGTGAALSVPLFCGSVTSGVLLVYPAVAPQEPGQSVWTNADRDQVARAAKTLSLALSMDAERIATERRQKIFAEALSDNLHQFKNPLQAMRTYGKLLQQRLADADAADPIRSGRGSTRQLLELADHLLNQSDRLTARLKPVDAMLDEYKEGSRPLALMPAMQSATAPRWTTPLLPFSNNDTSVADSAAASNGSSSLVVLNSAQPTSATSSLLGSFDCEMTFVSDALPPILDSFRAIAVDKRIHFEIEEAVDLPGVMANTNALQEAVTNLVDNAFKYVVLPRRPSSGYSFNPKPKVRVTIFPNDETKDGVGVTILVEDNGPGIPEDAIESIFQRGYRGDSVQGIQGNGIGLAIAKDLVEKMRGHLGVVSSSEKGKVKNNLKGARFQIQLFRHPK